MSSYFTPAMKLMSTNLVFSIANLLNIYINNMSENNYDEIDIVKNREQLENGIRMILDAYESKGVIYENDIKVLLEEAEQKDERIKELEGIVDKLTKEKDYWKNKCLNSNSNISKNNVEYMNNYPKVNLSESSVDYKRTDDIIKRLDDEIERKVGIASNTTFRSNYNNYNTATNMQPKSKSIKHSYEEDKNFKIQQYNKSTKFFNDCKTSLSTEAYSQFVTLLKQYNTNQINIHELYKMIKHTFSSFPKLINDFKCIFLTNN
jgi:hypothetical protein